MERIQNNIFSQIHLNKMESILDEGVNENTIKKLLSYLEEQHILEKHPFFQKINMYQPYKIGIILSPFYFAVHNWLLHLQQFHTKLSRLHYEKSAELVYENINDETGIECGITNLEKSHTVTFIIFLHVLGYHNQIKSSRSIIEFNSRLDYSLGNKFISHHASVLGAIEHLYISVSTILKNYCDKYGIVQEHYNVHEILDQKHSMDFFRVAINDNATPSCVINGIINGYQLLWNIYEELLKEYEDDNVIKIN